MLRILLILSTFMSSLTVAFAQEFNNFQSDYGLEASPNFLKRFQIEGDSRLFQPPNSNGALIYRPRDPSQQILPNRELERRLLDLIDPSELKLRSQLQEAEVGLPTYLRSIEGLPRNLTNQENYTILNNAIRYPTINLNVTELSQMEATFSGVFETLNNNASDVGVITEEYLNFVNANSNRIEPSFTRDEILERAIGLGNIDAAFQLNPGTDAASLASVISSLDSMSTPDATSMAARLRLDQGRLSPLEAAIIYEDNFSESSIAGIGLAELSLQNPNADYSLSQDEAFGALRRGVIEGQFVAAEAYIDFLIDQNETAKALETYASFQGLAATSLDRERVVAASAFQCRVNVAVEDCVPLPLFYITDRDEIQEGVRTVFSNGRIEGNGPELHMGIVQHPISQNYSVPSEAVSIATSLTLQWPFAEGVTVVSLAKPEIVPDISNDLEAFITELRSFADEHTDGRLLLNFHGFNNTFDAASLRLAQLSLKAEYPSTPVLISFASGASARLYGSDKAMIIESCRRFRPIVDALIEEFAYHESDQNAEDPKIDILTHSLGTDLFFQMAMGCPNDQEPPFEPWVEQKFRLIAFAAADLNRNLFEQAFDDFQSLSQVLFNYTSRSDSALLISRRVNGLRCIWPFDSDCEVLHVDDYSRLGTGGEGQFIHANLQTIDATILETTPDSDSIGHAYVFGVPAARRDLAILLNGYFEDSVVRCIIPDQTGQFFHIQADCNN